jgi:2-keto-4-pentenoate hydratase/2-oxohepta-3-ene-1,7-dioic acid hydratase in catechol pathway
MRLLYADEFRLCVLARDQAIDISDLVRDLPHRGPEDLMAALIADFDRYRAKIEAHVETAEGKSIGSVRVRAPIPRPRNMVCMARNYMESGTLKEPEAINAFHKAPGAVIGPGDVMVLPDAPASNFECEAEVAVIIGKRATNVTEAEAMDHVFGYVPFIDGSARGLPPDRNVFFQAKSRDTFAPMGPWIVTADEVADPYDIPIKLWVNGVLKQDFNTSDMGHNIARCIAWASSIHTLQPGDVLATGTNHRGLSSVQDGDLIELECGGIGRIAITIRDDLKRRWPRETRLERQEKGLPPLPPQESGKYAS